MDNVKDWTWMNYFQQHTTGLAGGGFLYRHRLLSPKRQIGQGIDRYDDDDDDDDDDVRRPDKHVD
ncbi:hypothetical protein DPMN_163184 [Dreissena polymorpha]|uniref:Uncharacterized protein n=1 Tax=Dreissena polymorpha TaxID=45954 RepID=A0A9D4EW45_DREPO|nr:hypothetical protein DPMN_163184 [Dreissena polymorpha]